VSLRKVLILFILLSLFGVILILVISKKEEKLRYLDKSFKIIESHEKKAVYPGIISWQKEELKRLLEEENLFLNNKDCLNLDRRIEQINWYLLKNQCFLDSYYKEKYPNISAELQKLSYELINEKAQVVVENFWNSEKETILEFKEKSNQAVVDFYGNLQRYLEKVKETNSELFVSSLFSYRNLVRYIKADNKKGFLREFYQTHFLSESMLNDAVSVFTKQYEMELYSYQVNFLKRITEDFIQYLKLRDKDIVVVPKLSEISKQIQVRSYQLPTSDFLYIDDETINDINAIVKRVISVEGIDVVLTFTPLSLLADGGTFLYEKRLHSKLDAILSRALKRQLNYIWIGLGYKNSLEKVTSDFVYQTLQNTQNMLLQQYKLINVEFFVEGRK